MSNQSEDNFNNNIKQSLDDSVDTIDANTLSKIRQIRAQAISRNETRDTIWRKFVVGGLVTACVMVLAVVLLLNSPTSIESVPVDELELISASDNLELFEDLEFYEWLEEDDLPS